MTDESDLYYMRARYYNPIAKRFLSPDTLVGNISNPQSQNRYIYCEGNPANYVDPTGYDMVLATYCTSTYSSMDYGELYAEWIGFDALLNNENLSQVERDDLLLKQQFADLYVIIRGNYSQDDRDHAQLALANLVDQENIKEMRRNNAAGLGLMAGQIAAPAVSRLVPEASVMSEAGTLSNVEARQWYLQQEARIPGLIDKSAPLKTQARQAFELRNQLRTQARELMADRKEAARLMIKEPNMSWGETVAKYQARGYQGDDLWKAIIEASQRSRPSVNKSLGL